jgi:4-alpha-glucanotransferase
MLSLIYSNSTHRYIILSQLQYKPISSTMAVLNSLSLLFSPKLTHSSSIPFPLFTSQSNPLSFNLTSKSVALSATPSHFSVAVGEDLPVDYGEWFPKRDPGDRRRAGILLHPTSFRGPYGIGDLGDEAFRFIDWLHDAGCSVWQVLPSSS